MNTNFVCETCGHRWLHRLTTQHGASRGLPLQADQAACEARAS